MSPDQKKLAAAVKAQAGYYAENKELKRKLRSLEEQHEALLREKDVWHLDVERLREQYEGVLRQLSEGRRSETGLRSEIVDAHREIAGLKEQYGELESKYAYVVEAHGHWKELAERFDAERHGLQEQLESQEWKQGVREKYLREQLETHDAMLRRVFRYLNGSRYLVGADGLAEDVEALLSKVAPGVGRLVHDEPARGDGTQAGSDVPDPASNPMAESYPPDEDVERAGELARERGWKDIGGQGVVSDPAKSPRVCRNCGYAEGERVKAVGGNACDNFEPESA